MEGIIVLKGTVADMTGFRDGCAIVKLGYTEMKYYNNNVKIYAPEYLHHKKFVDIPYKGACRLENPEIFGFDPKEQPTTDGFGVPVNKLHQGDDVTAYIRWKDTKDGKDREVCEVVIIGKDLPPQSLKELVDEVADELSA